MKLKCVPEDFQVDEQLSLQPSGGRFAFYELTKTSLGTPEAVDAVVERWNLSRRQVGFAGLKDRHALTRQFVTIENGPRQDLRQTSFQLAYRGQVPRPVQARDIEANRFTIVMRDLSPAALTTAQQAIGEVSTSGVANYFDEQRFGSLGDSGEFIGKPWCLANYERALWLALAEPNVHDRPMDRDQKRILRDYWGRWLDCKNRLGRSHRRSIVTFLADKPTDFKRALALVRQDLRSIWLAAFQSDLWNRMLTGLIRRACRPEQIVEYEIGPRKVCFFRKLDGAQQQYLDTFQLPLPSARTRWTEGVARELAEQVLTEEGMEPRELRVKYPRDSFFSKGDRAAVFRPSEVGSEVAADELYPSKQKLTLKFLLPRGAYATIVVKRITGIGVESEPDPVEESEAPESGAAEEN
jgi:tRNA pseudouridine13 synthase